DDGNIIRDVIEWIVYSHFPHFALFFFLRAFLKSEFSGLVMAQANQLVLGGSSKRKETLAPRLKITVPYFDNTELIKGCNCTLIVHCMNLTVQEMKALLFMLPRIWKVEERVAGADLRMGRFQFDFVDEEDIQGVLQMGPIGQAIGTVKQVDLDGGRVQIAIDGFKPIIFETTMEFHSGEETTVILRYERLHVYCRECRSLCHESSGCPTLLPKRERRDVMRYSEEKPEGGGNSYKGALRGTGERTKDITDQEKPLEESSRGKGVLTENREEQRLPRSGGVQQKVNGDSLRRFSRPLPPREDSKRFGGTSRNIHRSKEDHSSGLTSIKDKTEEGTENKHGGNDKDSPPQHSAKKVRKGLMLEDNTMTMDDLNTRINQVVMEESEKAVMAEAEAGVQEEEGGRA
ncbi:unnamed protein product, partial [Thlaspi arvense]